MKKVTKKARIKKGSTWINDDGDELKVNDVTIDKVDGVTYVHYEYLDGGIDFTDDATFLWLFKPKDDAITVGVKTAYDHSKLVNAEIEYIEVDNVEDTYELESDDDSALLLECKRIIHDAVHYKLLDGDDEIETNFYGEVYA